VHFTRDCFPDLLTSPSTSNGGGGGESCGGMYGVLSDMLGIPPEDLLAESFADPDSIAMALGNTSDAAQQVVLFFFTILCFTS
jgi:hypothetical protein